jgi:Holliday junction resolvasome RuvABC endonuclease subunit
MSVMGVDLGIRKAAVFVLDGEDRGLTHVLNLEKSVAGRALQLLEISSYVHDVALMHKVDQVWIEDTVVGNNQKYSLQLTEVRGAVMAALALYSDVRLVNNKTWKREVVGNGNATKDSVRDYIHVTHGAYAPLCGDDQDLYDACCISLYGRQISERARNLQLEP